MREPKVIQIMPVNVPPHEKSGKDNFFSDTVVGLALMEDGHIRPIIYYYDDDEYLCVKVVDLNEKIFREFVDRWMIKNRRIKIARKELAKWEDKLQAGRDIVNFAKSHGRIEPGLDLLSTISNETDLSEEEVAFMLEGKREITPEECSDICHLFHMPLDWLPDMRGELPF